MMKKIYEKPLAEVMDLELNDILCESMFTSLGGGTGGTKSETYTGNYSASGDKLILGGQ